MANGSRRKRQRATAWLWRSARSLCRGPGPRKITCTGIPVCERRWRDFQPHIIDLWEEPWGLVSAQTCWLRNRYFPDDENPFRDRAEHQPAVAAAVRADAQLHAAPGGFCGRPERGSRRGAARERLPRAGARSCRTRWTPSCFTRWIASECRRELGLSGFVAGYVGRLVPRKGLLDMIDALPRCSPDVNLLFVGSGEQQAILEARVRELGIEARRALPRRSAERGAAGDHERARCARAPVAHHADVEGAIWPRDHRGARLRDAGDRLGFGRDSGSRSARRVSSFPRATRRRSRRRWNELRASPEACRRLGELGRQRVEERFTWQRVAERMRDIYLTMCPDVVRSAGACCMKTPRRILFFDHTAALGGGEIALLHLVAAMDRTRFEPVVVLGSDGPLREKLERAGIETHMLRAVHGGRANAQGQPRLRQPFEDRADRALDALRLSASRVSSRNAASSWCIPIRSRPTSSADSRRGSLACR